MATLFIGMPVYNGEKFIERALESLRHQTYSDWTLLISDNDSQDATASICEFYCKTDERIHYIKQNENIGALNNFVFLLQSAETPFFMWAAADDEWNEKFIEACLNGMNRQKADWGFSNIVNIDTFGNPIREYKSFTAFATTKPYFGIANYVLSPEIFGKANLIYGIYRLSRLKDVMLTLLSSPLAESQSYDMAFNLGILCHARLYIDERVLFHKRYARITDQEDRIDRIQLDKPYIHGTLHNNDFQEYKQAMLEVSKDTEFGGLVQSLMEYRQELQKEINLTISELNEEHNQEMAIQIEAATWKFAKWPWLKKMLKNINFLRKQYFRKIF
jgi:glycosyltransferase involved in cell wall biosynthesis